MKPRPVGSSSHASRAVVIALALLGFIPLLVAAGPDWWVQRGVLKMEPGGPPPVPVAANDYAAVNQGQLKQLATAAFDELQAELPGGAGADVTALIRSWFVIDPAVALPTNPALRVPKVTPGVTSDYAAANTGQLKFVAKLVYDRLKQAGYTDSYPWTADLGDDADYAVANLGQVKYVFRFDITFSTLDDGIPDWWRARWSLTAAASADSDSPPDGMSNFYEFRNGLNPTSNDGSANLDGDTIPNREDARPNDAMVGRLSIAISTPLNNSILP